MVSPQNKVKIDDTSRSIHLDGTVLKLVFCSFLFSVFPCKCSSFKEPLDSNLFVMMLGIWGQSLEISTWASNTVSD